MVFMYDGFQLKLVTSTYQSNGCLAVRIVDAATGEPWGTLSANMPGHTPPDGVFYLKDWSENEGIAEAVVEAGLIVPACGEGVPIAVSGYIYAEPYRLKS